MRIISLIEGREVIQTILKHLGLWLVKSRPIPKAHAPPAGYIRDQFSEIPMNEDHLYRDPDYPWDVYLQSQRSGIRGGRNRWALMSLKNP